MAAEWHEHHDHVIAPGEIVHARPELFNDPRRLVTERHRRRPRPVTVNC
jgi:hypothetical protein